MRTPRSNSALCLAIVLALGLTSCKPAGNAPADSAATPAPTTETAAPAETTATPESQPGATTEQTPAPAEVPAAPAAVVLSSADGEQAGVRVEVTEFKRSSGDTVNLKFVLINDSDEVFSFASGYMGEAGFATDYRTIGGVHLVDPAGKKKYLVVRDADRKCLCSTEIGDVEPKSRANLWTKFSAPPADVQKLSIVVPHFSPMDDVTLGQ